MSVTREPAVGIEPTTARSQKRGEWPTNGAERNGEDSNGSPEPAQDPKRPPEPQRNRNEARPNEDRALIAVIAAIFFGLNIGDDRADSIRRARELLAEIDEQDGGR